MVRASRQLSAAKVHFSVCYGYNSMSNENIAVISHWAVILKKLGSLLLTVINDHTVGLKDIVTDIEHIVTELCRSS